MVGNVRLGRSFPHLAKRALAEDFEQFELRWISFLAALFHMVSDRDLLIGPFILHKQPALKKKKIKHARLRVYVPEHHACCYLHSARKTLPPPLARP